jgi:hypothetical protein
MAAARDRTYQNPTHVVASSSNQINSSPCEQEASALRIKGMNDHSHPSTGKIEVHGNGMGVASPDAVEKRAREIAMIAERDPDEFTDADWDQARRELLGTQTTIAPEETEANAEVVEEWNVVASSTGHRAPRVEDDENLGEQLVSDGMEEAVHDQMLEARKEELEEEKG